MKALKGHYLANKMIKKISSLKTYLHASEDCGSDFSIKKVQKDYYTF